MFLPSEETTNENINRSIIATIDGYISPDTNFNLLTLADAFKNYPNYELRLATDDWCIGENQPIKHVYVDRIKEQLVLVCRAEI